MDWAEQMADVDASVDAELGDEFEFAADGASFVTLHGFVFPPGSEAQIDFSPVDPISGKPRLKVAKSVIATPSKTHRFRIPQLADPDVTKWRPENWESTTASRYWLIDLQKAVT